MSVSLSPTPYLRAKAHPSGRLPLEESIGINLGSQWEVRDKDPLRRGQTTAEKPVREIDPIEEVTIFLGEAAALGQDVGVYLCSDGQGGRNE